MKDKIIKVIFSKEADEQYKELNKIVGEEIKKEIKKSEHQTLLRSLERVKDLIKDNIFIGTQIPKKFIPKKYISLYGINNLFKIDLSGYWRLLYSVKGNKIEIVAFVLDFIDHDRYNKIFGYKKK